jgi:hypothetical protein
MTSRQAALIWRFNSIFQIARPRHTTIVFMCTIAVLSVVFANTFAPLKFGFYGLFGLALLVPFLSSTRIRTDPNIAAAGLAFIAYNFIVLLMHPLNETSLYNGLLAMACVALVISFSGLRPEPGQLVAFVRQLGFVVRVLLIAGLLGRLTGLYNAWNAETGFLWVLLFFLLIDPKASRLSKFIFVVIWYVNAFSLNDRFYLLTPIVVFGVYFLWPALSRLRFFGALLLIGFFAALAIIPVIYVQLSFSEYRQLLDGLAIEYTGDRFFSGRDVIWYHLLNDAVNQGIAFGAGHATTPEGLFMHDVSAHNTYVSILTRTGIIGLSLFFLVFLMIFVKLAHNRFDPVVRWSAAFSIGILFKQSTELSMIGNNVALGIISWFIVAFGFIHVNVMMRNNDALPQKTER